MTLQKKGEPFAQITMLCRGRSGWSEAKKDNEKESYS